MVGRGTQGSLLHQLQRDGVTLSSLFPSLPRVFTLKSAAALRAAAAARHWIPRLHRNLRYRFQARPKAGIERRA
jgi:hypothetical protein